MRRPDQKLSTFLLACDTLFSNARGNQDISSVLHDYGYTLERLAQGLVLLHDVQEEAYAKLSARADYLEVSLRLRRSLKNAKRVYMKSLTIARIAFGNEPEASQALVLRGARKRARNDWFEQAETFYANLLSTPSFTKRLSNFGYTTLKLQEEATVIQSLHTQVQAQAKAAGEAQQATSSRNQKLIVLKKYVSELKALCRVAFAEDRQQLEKLGILALNKPRPKKKKDAMV